MNNYKFFLRFWLFLLLFSVYCSYGMEFIVNGAMSPFTNQEVPDDCMKNIFFYVIERNFPIEIPKEIENSENTDEDRYSFLVDILAIVPQIQCLRRVCVSWKDLLSNAIPFFNQEDQNVILRQSVTQDNFKIAAIALSKGANINTVCVVEDEKLEWLHGATPLFSAVYNGNVEIVRMLLEKGAFTNIVTTGMVTVKSLLELLMNNLDEGSQLYPKYKAISELLSCKGTLDAPNNLE
jgi:hypothetical protein